MTTSVTNIFSEFIYETENVELANSILDSSEELLSLANRDYRYNHGITTYFSVDQNIKDYKNWKDENLQYFFVWVRQHIENYLKNANIKMPIDYEITSAWLSNMFQDGYHEFHLHSGNGDHICGNFYIFSDPGSSSLTFLRPEYYNDPWKHLPCEKWESVNSLEWHVPPIPGKLVLWKSNLLHGVRTNASNKRIALSFNVRLYV